MKNTPPPCIAALFIFSPEGFLTITSERVSIGSSQFLLSQSRSLLSPFKRLDLLRRSFADPFRSYGKVVRMISKQDGGDRELTRSTEERPKKRKKPPAKTPEARENQLIELAVELAEEQLLNGTASAQVITHFLKLGTTRANLETEKLKRENELLKAKTENLESMKRSEELYTEAIAAMRRYSGMGSANFDED